MDNHQTTTNYVPEPRRAVTELPDQASVDAAGIDLDLEMARLVSDVIFRQAARGRSKTRTNLYDTIIGLVFLGRQAIERNGDTDPAPFPDLPTGCWPQGKEVLRHLGITNRDLEAYCRPARQRADDACLPLEWALAFFPAPIWPVIAEVIRWGPEQVSLRMEWAVTTMAQTTTQRNRRRRPAGSPLSLATIEHYIGGIWQLMDVLLELRSIATNSPVLPLGVLDAWTTKPKRIDARAYGARPADQDNTGPSLEACSARLKALQAQARVTTQRDGYLRRRRALFMALVCMFGPRPDAFLKARVEDYLPNHRYPDGTSGAALRIFPAKTWDPDEAHYLPLPGQVARWVEDWIVFTGRSLGEPNEPLFPNRKPKPGRAKMFLTTHGLYTAIAGARQQGGTGSYALLPRGDDPFIGFHPHGFRHTALQLAVRAASNLQRADASFFPHVHPQEFGKVIVGHELITEIGGIYRDLDRQLLCRAVVDEMWRILYDDGILRRGPDPARIRQARAQKDALKITIDALRHEIHDLDAKTEQLTRRAGTIQDHTRKLELQLQAAQHSNAAHARRDEVRRLEQSLEQAAADLTIAQTTLIPVPDDLTDAEHARLVAEALGEPDESQPPTPSTPLADELTVTDAAQLWGTTEQAINRWYRHGPPKHRPVPWRGGQEAWHIYTQKDKRLRVDAINALGLTEEQTTRLELVRKRRAPLDAADRRTLPPPPEYGSKNGEVQDTPYVPKIDPSKRVATLAGRLDAWETSGSSPPA